MISSLTASPSSPLASALAAAEARQALAPRAAFGGRQLLFSQAFYLSLEHSYLYSACSSTWSSTPSGAEEEEEARAAAGGGAGGGGGRVVAQKSGAETLEVPAHF